MPNPQTDAMKRELADKRLFQAAQNAAYRYIDDMFDRNVYPAEADLRRLRLFDEELSNGGCDPEAILQLLDAAGSPNTLQQTGARYFGFVNGGALPVCLAVRWLADVWDQNAVLHVASPISAKIEDVCRKWLTELFGLPQGTAAGFVTGSSIAAFCALAAARNRQMENAGWDVRKKGLFGAPFGRIYLADTAHATIFKALSLLGFGEEQLVLLPTDDQGRVRVDALPANVEPCSIFVLQAGNVNTGAFDELEPLCRFARAHGCWVHIDGAFGLWAAASAKLKLLLRGMELADSWSVDAHKTLNVPYDCGIVLCRDESALVSAMRASGDYLIHSSERDNMNYVPDMSRRARGFELWAALKYLGRSGVETLVDRLHDNACYFARRLQGDGFLVLNDVHFNQLLVACGSDEATQTVLKTVQEDRVCWCGGTRWQGRAAIRISVCNWSTTPEDIDACVESFGRAKALANA